MSLSDFWILVQRWFLLILAPVFIAFNVLFALHFLKPPSHEASIKLQVSVPQTEEVSLNDRYRFSNLLDEIRTSRSNFLDVLKASNTFKQAKEAYLLTGEDLASAEDAENLSYDLSVAPIRDADFLTIKFSAETPEEAVAIANLHTQIAIENFGQLRALPVRALQDSLSLQFDASTSRLQKAEKERIEFQINNGFASLNEAIGLREELISDLKREKVNLISQGNDRRDSDEVLERLDASIAETQEELLALLALQPELTKLDSAINQEALAYERLLSKLSEAEITASTIEAATFIQVVQEAGLPTKKLTPYLDYLPLAIIGSLGLGILLAYLMTFLMARLGKEKSKDEKSRTELRSLYKGQLEAR